MMTTRYYKYSILLVIALCFLLISNYLKNYAPKPKLVVSKQKSSINFDSKVAIFFSLGQRRLISDLIWISTLIESDLEHYKGKDLNSWMYLRFKNMTNYDPLFYKAYLFGGKYLNIVKDDLLGAHEIYKKSEEHFKSDYELNLNAGFLYAFELNWASDAIIRYERILNDKKVPVFIKSLVLKLKKKEGMSLDTLFSSLTEMHKNENDAYLKEKLEKELYAVKAELDLSCLNANKNNCDKYDYNGVLYHIDLNGKYSSSQNYKEFKIYER